ncbi:MAG: LamG-like jellyroll fold domain-containing protein [Sedimentisphaerales bacterium]|nr:LamG-like jellyroll fold domain-containing protein [Sedimentisphaerales bacterium]
MFYAEKKHLERHTLCAENKAKVINPAGRKVINYRLLTVMQYRSNKIRSYRGMTLVEILIAMAIMAIVFSAVVPQFRAIQNSWDSKQSNAEVLQNGRILIDHLNRNLSTAARITAVSGPAETNGYIEFEDNDANNLRFDINGTSNYVEFGPVGSLYDLAGPVSQLLFTCYDSNDLGTPITDVNEIRFIKVQTTITNPAAMGQDKTFTTYTYLRISSSSGDGSLVGWWKLDETEDDQASDSSGNRIDGTLTQMNPATDWVTGKLGGGLDFDGFNDYVNCGNDSSLDITDEITLAAWIKMASRPARNHWSDVLWKENAYSLYLTGQEDTETVLSAYFVLNTGTLDTWKDADIILPLNTWVHVAVTYDGTDAKGYVNGVYDFTKNKAGTIVTNTSSFTFGRSDDQYFEGSIDDVHLFNRALSQEEIVELVGGVFQQDEGSDGIVSMEAEHYTNNAPKGGHQWTLVTSPGGYSDEGAMEATPDSGTNQDTDYAAYSPRLDFLVNFVKTGTHYVWVRGYGKDGAGDSCHAGLDGQEISTCDRVNYYDPFYAWHSQTMDGPDATFNVTTTGIHTFNIWMCEDGFVIDKIVLTSSISYMPIGSGPAESEQSEPGGRGGLIP